VVGYEIPSLRDWGINPQLLPMPVPHIPDTFGLAAKTYA
jgi:hypothetical protein